MSGRAYSSLEEALSTRDRWVEFPGGGCSCRAVCSRMDPVAGDDDWYGDEADDPEQDA